MSALLPDSTTIGDLLDAALRESGKLGVGQTALADDTNAAWARVQWMLQEWERKRWLVYHLVTYLVTGTGANPLSVGPGGNIDTGAGSARPDKLEFAFLRQIQNPSPNQVDYPLELLMAQEDWDKVPLKGLVAFPKYAWYDAAWPLGKLYTYPVAQANIYQIGITIKEQLPSRFATLATRISLPYEYYNAIVLNLAIRLRSYYAIPTYPGDMLPGLAKDALNAVRGANVGISQLTLPVELGRPGLYNIYSDRQY